MKLFSIRELERLSGIKAHTIRVWEQRYQVFSPQRSNGNIRHYTLEDVQRLLCTALLLYHKHKISQLSRVKLSELEQRLQVFSGEGDKQNRAIIHLIFYMYTDIEKFEDVLDSCSACWGIDVTIEKVILPFMEKAELFSYKDKTYETHFVVTAIRKKIILGIEKATNAAVKDQSALLFLSEGEHYDLFLLYMAYSLKRNGLRVLYLGTDISFNNLKRIIELKKLNLLYTFIPLGKKFKQHDLINYLEAHADLQLRVVVCEDIEPGHTLSNVEFLHHKSADLHLSSSCQ